MNRFQIFFFFFKEILFTFFFFFSQEEQRWSKRKRGKNYIPIKRAVAKGWAHILAPSLVKSTAFANYFFSWNLDFSHGLHVETQKGVLYKCLGLLWGIKDMIHVDQVWHVSGTCYTNQWVLSLCWIEQSFYYNLNIYESPH